MAAIRGKLVIGIFDHLHQAQAAVKELLEAGFTEAEIGLLARHAVDELAGKTPTKTDFEPSAVRGAETGAMTGAGVGAALALAVATGVFPAVGPVVAAGLFAGYLAAGAAGGAMAGSVIGGLVGLGVAEHEGNYYEDAVRAGRILVTVHSVVRQDQAVEILNRNGAENIEPHGVGKEPTHIPHLHLGEGHGMGSPPGGFAAGGGLHRASPPHEGFHLPPVEKEDE